MSSSFTSIKIIHPPETKDGETTSPVTLAQLSHADCALIHRALFLVKTHPPETEMQVFRLMAIFEKGEK